MSSRLCVQEIPPDRHCLQMAGKCGPLPLKTDEKQDLVKRRVSAQAKPFQNKETVYTGCQLTSAKKRRQSHTGAHYTPYTIKLCWVEIRLNQGNAFANSDSVVISQTNILGFSLNQIFQIKSKIWQDNIYSSVKRNYNMRKDLSMCSKTSKLQEFQNTFKMSLNSNELYILYREIKQEITNNLFKK